MSYIFIVFSILAILAVAGGIYYMRNRPVENAERADVEYVCSYCGERDCECHKKEPEA